MLRSPKVQDIILGLNRKLHLKENVQENASYDRFRTVLELFYRFGNIFAPFQKKMLHYGYIEVAEFLMNHFSIYKLFQRIYCKINRQL